jgi:hypothetical protein
LPPEAANKRANENIRLKQAADPFLKVVTERWENQNSPQGDEWYLKWWPWSNMGHMVVHVSMGGADFYIDDGTVATTGFHIFGWADIPNRYMRTEFLDSGFHMLGPAGPVIKNK